MRRYSSDFPSLVNAAIVSMGRVINYKGGFNTDLSPEQIVTEETKVELRQRYVCYEEARRQLEFLEQGGDPLDFRPGNSASLSVQSTSLTDQHPEQFVVSEAKDSFALAASPPGDSVESSGRPGAPPAWEPNSADNLMLFDGANDDFKCDGSLIRSSRSIVVPSEHSSQFNGSQHAKESGDSAAFGLPKKAYKRRNRSRHGGRSSSTDVVLSSSGHTALPSRHVPREPKGLAVVEPNQKDQSVTSNSNFKPTNSNFDIVHKAEPSNIHLDIDSNGGKALELTVAQATGCNSDSQTDPNAFSNIHDNQHNKLTEFDTQISHKAVVFHKPESHGGSGYVSLGGLECDPSLAVSEAEVQDTCRLTNGLSCKIGDKNGLSNEVDDKDGILDTKVLDMEPLGSGTGVQVKGNFENETFTKFGSVDSNGYIKEDPSQSEEILNMEGKNSSVKHHQTKVDIAYSGVDVDQHSFHSHQGNGSLLKENEALTEELCGLRTEPNDSIANEGKEQMGIISLENEIVPSNLSDSNPSRRDESTCLGILPGSIDSSVPEIPDTTRDSNVSPEQRTCSQDLKLEKKVHDDSILEEARIIEAKRKRIAELSVRKLRLESCQKSHWAFVLEEMAWMANDFAQERLWKISAAAQMGRRASASARLKLVEQDTYLEKKVVARNLAKAVMEFWCLVQQRSKAQELQQPGKDGRYAVQRYALRFLQYNISTIQYVPAELCTVPDSISSPEIVDRSWKDLTEENLFYSIPSGAIESYRISIESEVLHWEKTGICMQEVQTSGYEALTEYGSQGYTLEEDEEETSAYYMTGAFENGKPIKLAREKKKHLMNEFAARSYEMGSDSTLMQSYETKAGHQSVLIGKRPSNTLNVSIPTKRVRTAPRQRVLSPFNVGTHGCLQGPNKTDASSGDTNSFQDDRNISQGGSSVLNNMEVESVRNFDRQLPVDSSEVSHKPKKKKAKNLGSTYEYNWPSDSSFQNEQRDNHKRRLESHHIESNGSSGLYGQHIGKKSKFNKQTLDNSVDNVAPVNCSISSPVASQMSNMPNPSKLIKMLGGRDRGRKTKALKGASGQPDSGTSWSLFEDQALVVLVHDMGPNWNLVSDAFNSTLKFKCIFRKPKECMDRHKVLMDSPAGEGADSADDSGSSQPYRSTLPGIPKGSARQLFQRLQGPIEEDTIKSHLEKIIAIGNKQHQRRAQDPRQLQQPHNSHTYALSQVCPNNLNGEPILTPLDLLDATSSSPDVLPLGYQSPHSIGLPNSNQCSVSPMLPASGANPSSQASTSAVPGSNFSSASSQLNASVRDGRSGIPRSTDEQQRLQQYNQMLASRNFQHNNTPISGVHSGSDRGGVHILTGGNGVGNPSGMNKNIAVPRPGHQGIASSSLLGPGSVLSSGVMAVPNPVNIHSGSGQGKSMMRPRDSMHMMRPTQNVEHQRPMMIPELKGQVSQGNSQGISPFGAISSSFSNQTTPPSVPSYLLHHQQVHPMSTQQSHVLTNTHHPHLQGPNVASNTHLQAYAIRIAKEKHIQQQLLLQKHQQQQYAASNSLMTHVPGQPQLKVPSPQNSSQAQTTSPQVLLSPLPASSSLSSLSQHSQKHHIPPHIAGGNPQVSGSGLTNQVSKQRQPQHQQFQQSGRQHTQQRHQSQSQHQAKNLKGAGRGIVVHQNHPTDSTVQNGPLVTTESHTGEVGEQSIRTIPQGLYSGAGLNSVQPQKQLVPSHISHQPQPQQKLYSGQTISSKQLQQTHAHSESSNQNHVLPAAAGPTSISSQAVSLKQQPHQQSHPQPKLVNQTQTTAQRVLQQNRQVNSDHANKLQAKDAHAGMHNVNSFSPIVSTAPVPICVDVANVEPAVTSASTPQQKASEQVSDPSVSNPATLISSSDTLPSTNPPTQILPPVCLGIENIQSSGSLPDVGYDSAVQWSEEHPRLQPPALPPPLEQQQVESKQQSEEHLPLLQEGGSSS